MDIIAVVKEHPIPIGIGVVVLLLLVMSRGGGSSGGGGNGNAVAAQAQAYAQQSNVQLSGIASQTSIALGAQNVTNKQTAENAATSRMGVAASLLSSFGALGAQTDMNRSNNTLKVVQSAQSSALQGKAIDASLAAQDMAIKGNIQMNGDNIAAQLKALTENNNAKLAQIGAATQGNIAMIGAQTAGNVAQIQAGYTGESGLLGQQLAYNDKNLSTVLQHQENVAKITGQNQVQIVQAQQQAANTAAQGTKNASDWGVVGNIAKTLFSFF